MRHKIEAVGLKFISFRRLSRYRIGVLCRDQTGRFWPIDASMEKPVQTPLPDVLDGALYADFIKNLEKIQSNNSLKLV